MSAATDLDAQATLFHASGLTKANLTATDATKYEHFEYSPDVDGLWLMHLSNFSSQVSGGYLRIKVPGNDTLRRYKARYVQAKPNGNILWYGDLVDDYGQETNGYATLTCYGGKVIGNFALNDQDYALYPIKDSLYLFIKEDNDVTYTCGYQSQGGETQLTGGEETEGSVQDRGCSSNEVKVMVLYTPAVSNFPFVDIDQYIDGLIAQANNALQNSAVSSSQLWFSLAYKGSLPGFTETSLINTDLNSFSTSSAVQSLRDANGADCVMLLTAGDYGNFLGLTVGLGTGCTISADKAFSIVQLGAASSRMTFTHELGHQFGCKHSFGNNNGSCERLCCMNILRQVT